MKTPHTAHTPQLLGRRQFVQSATLAAAAAAVLPRRTLAETPPAPAPALQTLAYPDVQLLASPLLTQFQHQHQLFLSLDDDALLKPFRQLTGQPAPGEDMGGWYTPSPLFDPPKNMTGYIPGHSFGQYLSGLARAYAVTGHKPTQAKVHRLVRAYAGTISPKFYQGYCLPAYTSDKTTCGLIDAHAFAASPDAVATLNAATDAVLPFLPPKALNREELRAHPHPNEAFNWDESYTLSENFYLAYNRGMGVRYRALARRFLQDDTYFNPLAAGHNVLPHQHAYSHVNALCSAMQSFRTDGSAKHLAAAKNGFRFVQEQSFVTGGWGPGESFQVPGSNGLADSLQHNHSSFETPCGAYGHFKITRYLLTATGDATYGDSMERVLYNTILGARPTRPDGVTFYYSDYSRNARKVDYDQKWPCCSGTFPQLTADYGISSYFRAPTGMAVNLYVPSRVTWQQGAARVSLTQTTNYPRTGEITFHVASDRTEPWTLHLRIPAWALQDYRVAVNGRAISTMPATEAGGWARIHRSWRNGDTVELTLPLTQRLEALDPQHPNLVALMRGPVAYFLLNPDDTTALTRIQLLAATPRSSASSDLQITTPAGPQTLRTFPDITTEPYRLYHQVESA